MSDIGRRRRWHRFTHPVSGKALIVPIDHGLTLGPIKGLDHLDRVRRWLDSGELTGVVMHKGMVERLGGACGAGLMVHLNGAVNQGDPSRAVAPTMKVRLAGIEAALSLGADAVSVHLDMGGPWSSDYLGLLGEVVDEAHVLGVPVLAMLYDKTPGASPQDMARQRQFMRAAAEVGADALKVQPPAELRRLPELLDGFSHTPVVFAGGEMKSETGLLAFAHAVAQYPAAGLCVGRNVFQRADPAACLRELGQALHRQHAAAAPQPRALAEEVAL